MCVCACVRVHPHEFAALNTVLVGCCIEEGIDTGSTLGFSPPGSPSNLEQHGWLRMLSVTGSDSPGLSNSCLLEEGIELD